jgi:hypothetical protein
MPNERRVMRFVSPKEGLMYGIERFRRAALRCIALILTAGFLAACGPGLAPGPSGCNTYDWHTLVQGQAQQPRPGLRPGPSGCNTFDWHTLIQGG